MAQHEHILGSLEEIIQAVRKPQRLLVTSHSNPDGDAVGSALSLTMVLEALGHQVTCFSGDPVPEVFRFLPGTNRIVSTLRDDDRFDATFVIDVFEIKRTGLADTPPAKLGKVYVVDHHITQGTHGDLQYIDGNAAASGVLVYRFAKLADVKLTLEMATNIYCCIMTDTGSFHYSSATPEAFAIAGEMVALGVQPWDFAQRVYESQPLNRLKLMGEVLPTLEVSADGRFASIHLDYATLKRYSSGADVTDGFINFPRSIAGVEVAIFIRENPDGTFKASLRSAGRVDVRAICQELGGGGHRNAAGCTLKGSLREVKAQVFAATEKYCRDLSSTGA